MKINLQKEKRARLVAHLNDNPMLCYGVSSVKDRKGTCVRPQFTRMGEKFCSPMKGLHLIEYLVAAWAANPYDTLGRKVAMLAYAANEATQGFNQNQVPVEAMADFILQNEPRLSTWIQDAVEGHVRLNLCDEYIKHAPTIGKLLDLYVGG